MIQEYSSDEKIAVQVSRVPEMYGFLIDRYEEKLDRYILRKTGLGTDERQDILQEVFLKAYRNIASFDDSLSFNAWIYRICHNAVINDWKKNKKYRSGISFDSDAGVMVENMLSDHDIIDDIDEVIDAKHIQSLILKLSSKYQTIIELRYLEDLSYDEISDVLQIPPGTVATRINRAKKQLAKLLENTTNTHD